MSPLDALSCRTWVRRAAWSGRSCTGQGRGRSSPAPWCCWRPSCTPSTPRSLTSSSHTGSFTTLRWPTRPWRSPSHCQPCLRQPQRSAALLTAVFCAALQANGVFSLPYVYIPFCFKICFCFFASIQNTTGFFEVITVLLLIIAPFLCKAYRPLHQYTADHITCRLILIDLT